jgi:hypothetical protein
MRERLLLGPDRKPTRDEGPYAIRNQRPEPECRYVIDDFEQRSALERWLLDYSPDSDAYTQGRIAVERSATAWLVRFRDARTGQERTLAVPMVGVPAPPGFKETT